MHIHINDIFKYHLHKQVDILISKNQLLQILYRIVGNFGGGKFDVLTCFKHLAKDSLAN